MRPSLFWDIRWCILIASYRRFGQPVCPSARIKQAKKNPRRPNISGPFLLIVGCRSEWLAPEPGRFTPAETSSSRPTHTMGGLSEPQNLFRRCGGRKILYPSRNRIPELCSSACGLVTTDTALPRLCRDKNSALHC